MRSARKFSITKREILVSIAIIAIMVVFGLVIHGYFEDSLMLKHQEYNLALQINNNRDVFEYGMDTNVGNAFVHGTLKCLDPVTYDEIGGEYSYIKKVKEEHTRHSRTVTKTKKVNGKTRTYTEKEYYWTWDAVHSQSKQATQISFLDIEFDYGAIDFPAASHIKTIQESNKIRYVYYGSPIEATGTVYAKLENNTVKDASFHNNLSIEEAHEQYTKSPGPVVFWIVWSLLIAGIVFVFVYVDNRWLEDRCGM